MDAAIDIGLPVRYPRTGTVGKIVRIVNRNGFSFAELDTTGMLYRIDLFLPTTIEEKTLKTSDREESIRQVEDERKPGDMSFQEIPNLDSACNGAG